MRPRIKYIVMYLPTLLFSFDCLLLMNRASKGIKYIVRPARHFGCDGVSPPACHQRHRRSKTDPSWCGHHHYQSHHQSPPSSSSSSPSSRSSLESSPLLPSYLEILMTHKPHIQLKAYKKLTLKRSKAVGPMSTLSLTKSTWF